MALVDAAAVAAGAPAPADPVTAHAGGLLAALTADAYAAMSSYSSLLGRENLRCVCGRLPARADRGTMAP